MMVVPFSITLTTASYFLRVLQIKWCFTQIEIHTFWCRLTRNRGTGELALCCVCYSCCLVLGLVWSFVWNPPGLDVEKKQESDVNPATKVVKLFEVLKISPSIYIKLTFWFFHRWCSPIFFPFLSWQWNSPNESAGLWRIKTTGIQSLFSVGATCLFMFPAISLKRPQIWTI